MKQTCACIDGLFLANNGECYECVHGIFNAPEAICECPVEKFKESNADETGCVCLDGYLMAPTGECIYCDEESPLFDALIIDECTCVDGATVVDGVCECKTGYMFYEDGASCVPCIEEADVSSLVDGVCTCVETHMLFVDECIPCSGVGAMLIEGECVCPEFATLSSSGVCECGEGFEAFNDKICVMCAGIGASLSSAGVCECGENAMLGLVGDALECVCKDGYLPSDTDLEACYLCDGGDFDAVENVCTCKEGENKILGADKTACICDEANNFLTMSDGMCTCCDESADLTSLFFNDECICVENASFDEETCECTCEDGFLQAGEVCVACDESTGAELDGSECVCPDDTTIIFEGACVTCSGLGARLNIKGACVCGPNEELVDGVCQCIDETFLPTDEACVKCFGLGAELNAAGECECTLEHSLFSPDSVGECICMSEDEGVFTFEPEDGDAVCVLCNEVGHKFDAETGECVNPADQFEDVELAEIRAQLDIFQACVFDFFVATTEGFDVNEAGQKALMIHIVSLDFSSVAIGDLATFLLDDEDDIFGSADIGIDLAVATTADNFFSIATLFNMLSVFKAEGVDLADAEVMDAVKAVTTVTFFELTAVTFDFDLFVVFLEEVSVTLEVVIAQIEIALEFSICLGPGISVGADGNCICDINLAIFDPETFSCVCNDDSGLIFDDEEAPTRCVCEDPLFAIVDDVCEVKPVEEIVAELDAFQMCVGAFFVESLDLDEACQTTVNYALFGLDFTDFGIGTLGTFLTDSADLLGDEFASCVELEVVVADETFFSIEVLVGIIAVFETKVEITGSFIADIDELITVDFWSVTAETFSLEVFVSFAAELDVDIEVIAVGLAEADDFVPCFGPGAVIKKGVCECEIDFMEYNADMGKSLKYFRIFLWF